MLLRMWTWSILSENCERLKNDDISSIQKPAKERMTRADAVQPTCWDRAQIPYSLQPRILRYVPSSLCIHACVIESMRNHESVLVHAKNGCMLSGATYDMLHMHLWLRAHKYAMIARPHWIEPLFCTPKHLVQCGVRRGMAAVQCTGRDTKKIKWLS